ncbi:glycoside hydrolase family 6 protein [Nocardioides pacificus]
MRSVVTRRPLSSRSWALSALAAAAVALATLAGLPVESSSSAASAAVTDVRLAASSSRTEVWQTPEKAYAENPTNPLANRMWGVYDGPQDQVYAPYQRASGTTKQLLGKIALRPRTKWYGSFVPDGSIKKSVQSYIAASQDGNPSKLVQFAVFRMEPWEHEACERRSTKAEKTSYRRWIRNLASGIGKTPTLVVMQPDGPFLFCAPDRAAKSSLLTFATKTLSALPNTDVYIDAGAADWCENDRGNDPARCAQILKSTGIRYARGFALDSTHYTGPVENIVHGSKIVDILKREGYGAKHFIIDTAKSGRPMSWNDVIPAVRGGLKDNARTCSTITMTRCVTLGIPPTVRVADAQWGMNSSVRALAARNVDGFVWFGRPWLENQAAPYIARRALDMARTTPYPGPK